MSQDIGLEHVKGRVGVRICVRVGLVEESGLRLCEETVDAGNVARERSHEQRGGSIQKQSAREEYSDRLMAKSFATGFRWAELEPCHKINVRNK